MTDLPKINIWEEPNFFQNRKFYQRNNHNWSEVARYPLLLNAYLQGREDALDARVNSLISNVEQPSELVDARQGIDGVVHPVVKDRLDASDKDLTNVKATRTQYPFRALVSSWSGSNLRTLDMYTTNDFQEFIPINKSVPLGLEDEHGGMGDISLHYINGKYKFLMVYSFYSTIHAAVSDDLINWTVKSINNTGMKATWAPDLFIDDDGTIYVFAAAGDDSTDTFSTYMAKINDVDNMTDLQWAVVNLPDPNSHTTHIDPTVIKANGTYYMAIKDETTGAKNIQIYSSTDLQTWAYVSSPAFGRYVEGPSLVEVDGIFYCYADGYSTQSSWRMQSTDMENWTNLTQTYASDMSRTQHFTITEVKDDEENTIIQKAVSFFNATNHGAYKAQKILGYPTTELVSGSNDLYPEDAVPMRYVLPATATADAEVILHPDKITHLTDIYFQNFSNYKIKIMPNDYFSVPTLYNLNKDYSARPYFGLAQKGTLLKITNVGTFDLVGSYGKFYVSNGMVTDSGGIMLTITGASFLDTSKSNRIYMREVGNTVYLYASLFPKPGIAAGNYQLTSAYDTSEISLAPSHPILLATYLYQGFVPTLHFDSSGILWLNLAQAWPSSYAGELYYNGPVFSHFI